MALLSSAAPLNFSFLGIFMIEQRRVEGPQAGPSDLIGIESRSWLIKKPELLLNTELTVT